jgi:hypothetical protein
MNRKLEIELEIRIATKVVEDLIAAGFWIDVSDGERIVLYSSQDASEIIRCLRSTNEHYVFDYLLVHKGTEHGWVRLIWGVAGLISDYTANLEGILKGANALAA